MLVVAILMFATRYTDPILIHGYAVISVTLLAVGLVVIIWFGLVKSVRDNVEDRLRESEVR